MHSLIDSGLYMVANTIQGFETADGQLILATTVGYTQEEQLEEDRKEQAVYGKIVKLKL